MDKKKKNLFILLGVIVVIVIIIIVAASSSKKVETPNGQQANQPAGEEAKTPEGETDTPEELAGETVEVNPILVDSTIAVPGANPITKDNKVVTQEGNEVKNDVVPMSPEAPQQTAPVAKEDLPSEVIKIEITANGFNPAEFSVKKNTAITMGVSSGDKFTHVFMFDDAALSAVAVGVGPNETRAISFNAPDTGEYTFHCDVPGHAGRGEVGKMIVK